MSLPLLLSLSVSTTRPHFMIISRAFDGRDPAAVAGIPRREFAGIPDGHKSKRRARFLARCEASANGDH